MLTDSSHQSSLFYLALAEEAARLIPADLQVLDVLLADEALVMEVRKAMRLRRPVSATLGRPAMAPDRLLRCAVLKHLHNWSLRELEAELRGNLVYRAFTRFEADPIPNFRTLARNLACVGEDHLRVIHERVMVKAREQGMARGTKLRVDTTVVESNIHYPNDSSLLDDGIRVLSRAMRKVADLVLPGSVEVLDHSRGVTRRLVEIFLANKSRTPQRAARMKLAYQQLMAVARAVLRQAKQVSTELFDGTLVVVTDRISQVQAAAAQLDHYIPLVQRVIMQARQRVMDGCTRIPNKLVSLFEPHTAVICKGKAHKPVEFGRVVRLDEVENGLVSGWAVLDGAASDQHQWMPAIREHITRFGKAPRMATADRGMQSAANERAASRAGVKKVVLPARGRLSAQRKAHQAQRWFRRGRKWRAGVEGTISRLKGPLGMRRAMYKEDRGFRRHVGWSVISNNLKAMARRVAGTSRWE